MKKLLENSQPDGVHFLIEFLGCDERQIDRVIFWKKTLKKGADSVGLSVINDHFYRFDPRGVTGFLLLASSHVSVHTWPEYKYVACDVFSCSSQEKTKKFVDYLMEKVSHKKVNVKELKRGYKFFNFQKIINNKNDFIIPVYSTGKEMKIKTKNIIGKIKSNFQDILFLDTYDFGRCLIINGIMQTSEKDHEIYDQAILKPLRKKDRKILILGGGDSYVAEMALKINPNLEIKIIEMDKEVVTGCTNYLFQKVFNDKRVQLEIDDALNYLKNTATGNEKFDGIVCDLTDEPVRKIDRNSFKIFYQETLRLSKDHLERDGWISLQGGASKVMSGYTDAASIIRKLLEKDFENIRQTDMLIPSFGENNVFIYGEKKLIRDK